MKEKCDIFMTIIEKLEKIEAEIHELKIKLKFQSQPLKLEGIWDEIEITEQDIDEAKKSLFKGVYNFENQ